MKLDSVLKEFFHEVLIVLMISSGFCIFNIIYYVILIIKSTIGILNTHTQKAFGSDLV